MIKLRRSEFREIVVSLIYINLVNGSFDTTEYEKEVLNRYEEVIFHAEEIDQIISNNLVRYTIDRLNLVDLAIVRNAVFEMKFTKLPHEIAINEAINLTKRLSNLDDDAAKRFNNKLLDSISKDLIKK